MVPRCTLQSESFATALYRSFFSALELLKTLILSYCYASALLLKAEDEAVDKLVEKAAVEAEGRMAQGSEPQVEMREGQQQFAATSGVGAKMDKEPVTTEADVVAPASGARIGDRVVGSKPEKTKKTKKAPSVKVSSRHIHGTGV